MDYTRLQNETEEELIYRICSEKDQIGTWQHVSDILNELLGYEYTESKYRKQYVGLQKLLSTKGMNETKKSVDYDRDYLHKVRQEMAQLQKERIKLQTANVERNRIDRSEARQEMYYEFIGSLIDTLPLPEFEPLFESEDGDNGNEKHAYLCCISDPHYGAVFKSENNEYSPQIFRERLEYLTVRLWEFVEQHKLRKIHIASLGDNLQGLLRMSDLKLNDTSVVKAVVDFSRLMALFLNRLSKYVDIDYYHVPMANHTQIRPLGTKASEIADEDLEYVIGNYIKDLCLDNPRIHVHLAEEGKSYVQIPIFDYEILAMHGHQIKNINTSLRDLSLLRRNFIDYLILGHYHEGRNVPTAEGPCYDSEVLICPSFVGSDPYSDSLMKGSHSAVKIFGFDDLYGNTETYKIILD